MTTLILCMSCRKAPHLQEAPIGAIIEQIRLDIVKTGDEPVEHVGYYESDGLIFATHTHRN